MAKTLDEAGVKRLIQEIKGANKNLNTPIPISTENTTESMAQNVKNIADYIEKAKAAGVANVDGMAVTCLIDGDESGMGYLYSYNDRFDVQGVLIQEDLVDNMVFGLFDGRYTEKAVIVADNNAAEVTSYMLNEGARRPILLTPSTTEVDEETYHKLLSDDVDVVFQARDGEFCVLTNEIEADTTWDFYFSCFSVEGETEGDTFIYAYQVSIVKKAPHTCAISTLKEAQSLDDIIAYNFIKKATLSPVLEEIDLTGTDEDRKAKLDQFETDWKALTGADDLTGARFVAYIPNGDSGMNAIMTWDKLGTTSCQGFGIDTTTDKNYNITVHTDTGSLTITPLFSHLEAITIYTDNTPEHMQANIDNIAAYEANLQELGVDTTNNYIIPIKFDEVDDEIGMSFPFGGFITTYGGYEGFVTSTLAEQYKPRHIWISQAGGEEGKVYLNELAYENQLSVYTPKSLNAKSLEAITIKTGNSAEDKAANVAAIKAYVDNLKLLGVDTTKGYMIPVKLDNGYHGFIMGTDADGEHTGVIKRSIYNYGGGWIFIDKIGTYNYLECLTLGSYENLTTTAKTIVPAINEVNALAKGYSTIFTPIELTTETAQNKTAIDARVAAFTAQGISLTNGCCIPVTYKGVYAGNISLINGDWYGLLVKNTNNPADNINIKLSADGTITEGNSAQ